MPRLSPLYSWITLTVAPDTGAPFSFTVPETRTDGSIRRGMTVSSPFSIAPTPHTASQS